MADTIITGRHLYNDLMDAMHTNDAESQWYAIEHLWDYLHIGGECPPVSGYELMVLLATMQALIDRVACLEKEHKAA